MLFKDTVELDSGLLIPQSAQAGRLLASDGSGNAAWSNITIVSQLQLTPSTTPSRNFGSAYTPSTTHPAFVTVNVINGTTDGTAFEVYFYVNGTFNGVWQSLKSNDISDIMIFVPANGTWECAIAANTGTFICCEEQILSIG